jgi:hypothetical protein
MDALDIGVSVGVPVDALLSAEGITPDVAERVNDADADGSGTLSIQEVVQVLRRAEALEDQGMLMRRQDTTLQHNRHRNG